MNVTPERPGRTGPAFARGLCLATVLAAGIAGFGAVYVMARSTDNGAGTPARPDTQRFAQATGVAPKALPSGPGQNPLSVGPMAAFVFKKAPEALPSLVFQDAKGRPHTLAEWKGRVVLLNLWATWCAPCRKEMPSLDRLQASLGSNQFEVLAVSADRFRALGGFDARYFCYGEDLDLCYRAACQGGVVRHVPAARARHGPRGRAFGTSIWSRPSLNCARSSAVPNRARAGIG